MEVTKLKYDPWVSLFIAVPPVNFEKIFQNFDILKSAQNHWKDEILSFTNICISWGQKIDFWDLILANTSEIQIRIGKNYHFFPKTA